MRKGSNVRSRIKDATRSLDQYIGSKIRERRSSMGISQEKLGEKVGITFQQVQKYERGQNRVSASMLYNIANILNVDFAFFTDGFGSIPCPSELHDPNVPEYSTNGLRGISRGTPGKPEDAAIVRTLSKIENSDVKRKFLAILKLFITLKQNSHDAEISCDSSSAHAI